MTVLECSDICNYFTIFLAVELGDYDPSIHVGNYVTEMRLLLRQTDSIEARIQVTYYLLFKHTLHNIYLCVQLIKHIFRSYTGSLWKARLGEGAALRACPHRRLSGHSSRSPVSSTRTASTRTQ